MIWREPPRGGYPDMRLFALSGLEQMRSYMRGYGVPPPIARLTGMRPSAVEPGDVTFTMPATGWLLSPAGVIGGGVLAILADAPLGSAVQTALPPFTPYTTAELSMTFLRPATPESGLLACRGTLIHAGRSIGLSACTIHDERGRLLAHGTSRCHVFPPVAPPPEGPPDIGEPAGPDPDPDPPDPH
ncbi:MAG: PaaI family thioesterase, partial [Actinobacteria bacterium]|nr:PaaI family thioesterase [Actinomycetota bacterium]